MNVALQVLAFEYRANKMLHQVDMFFIVLLIVYRIYLDTCRLIHRN